MKLNNYRLIMNFKDKLIAETRLREEHEAFDIRIKNLILNIQQIASQYPEYIENIEKIVNDCITVITTDL